MTEPVSLAQARLQCRIEADVTEDDALLSAYIVAARKLVEDMTGLTLVQRALVEHFEAFVPRLGVPYEDERWCPPAGQASSLATGRRLDRPLWLRAWPIVSVDGVAYTDTDGVAQTLAGTRAIAIAWPGKLWPAFNTSWPAISEAEGVTVSLTAGYADGEAPEQAVQAMMLLLGHWYRNREAVVAGDRAAAVEIPLAAQALCDMISLQRV